jgi:transcriptional regulator
MYIPAAFSENDQETLHHFIEQYSFGLLVSDFAGEPLATHLPFLLDRSIGPHGTLFCHLARSNPQWRETEGKTGLAIFSGPHAYITPGWYAARDVVPTWNYVAVHAYGKLQVIDNAAGVRPIVEGMVREYERSQAQPWELREREDFLSKMLAQIVGVRIRIERLEGKWKLSQNHPAERQARVIAGLQERGGENAEAIAAMMQQRLREQCQRGQ